MAMHTDQVGIPAPPNFDSLASSQTLLIGWGALAAASVVVAIVYAVRRRDVLPIAACVGALVCALNEPIYDVLGNLVYSRSDYVAYHSFGRAIPWSLVMIYVPYVGVMPYGLYVAMKAGTSRARLHVVAACLIGSVIVFEIINARVMHMWRYYSGTPWRGVLSGGLVQMAAMPLLCGLLYLLLPESTRWPGRVLAGIVIPTITLPMGFAATTWPLYVASHSDASQAVQWLGAACAVVLSISAIPAITWLAERWRVLTATTGAPAAVARVPVTTTR